MPTTLRKKRNSLQLPTSILGVISEAIKIWQWFTAQGTKLYMKGNHSFALKNEFRRTCTGYQQYWLIFFKCLKCLVICMTDIMCERPVLCLVAQLCPTLWDPMDCSPPGSSVPRDSPESLDSGILEWVTMPSSRESSQPRNQIHVSRIACGFFYHMMWSIRKNCLFFSLRQRWSLAYHFNPIITELEQGWVTVF